MTLEGEPGCFSGKAAVDSRIKALVLEPRALTAGWAKIEELHDDIVEFKKTGSPFTHISTAPGPMSYYVATRGRPRLHAPPKTSWM